MKARKGLLFAGGVLLGVLAGAAGMMGLRGGDGPYTSSPPATGAMGAPASTAFMQAVAGNCEMAPVLPGGGDGDGREVLQSRPGDGSASEVASLILSGKEAAAAGRQRDAEVDFLNACRNAAALKDGDPIPLADAMYQLGRHYATVGALGSPKARDLYQRAERLYSASLEAYRARYGENGEKTRFAHEGLVTVQQATGGKPPAAIAKAPAPPPAAPAPAPAVAVAPEPVASAAVASASATVATAPVPAPAASSPTVTQARPAPVRQARVHAEPREREEPVAPRSEPTPARVVEPAPPRIVEPAPPRVVAPAPPRTADAATGEAPRPRPQVRRAPAPSDTSVEPAEVANEAAPAPRRPRPVPVAPAEPRGEPDTSSSGYGGGSSGDAPQAEGSPTAQ